MHTVDSASPYSFLMIVYFVIYLAFLVAVLYVVFQIIRAVFKIPQFLEYRRIETELLAKIAEKLGVSKEEIDEVTEG